MPGKVTIVGAGNVGTATAFALALDGTASEIVLIDRNLDKAKGEIMDIEHGSAFMAHTEFTASRSYRDARNSDIVVITAGAAQAPGETRMQLLGRNIKILKSIVLEVKRHAPDSIIMLVTPRPAVKGAAEPFPADSTLGDEPAAGAAAPAASSSAS